MNYLLHILFMVEVYVILSLSMNLLAGFSGLLALCLAAFYGISAYVAAITLVNTDASFWMAMAGAVAFNAVSCLPVAFFASRLRNLYFALATLAWQIVVYSVLYNWTSVTRGPFGIAGIPRPVLFGHELGEPWMITLLSTVLCLLCWFFFVQLNRTHLARLFLGTRDDQLAMTALGHNPARYQTTAVVISSMAAAVAGSLFAVYYSYIDPSSFTLDESILIISIVLIGGLGTLKGSVAGALFYVLLPEGLRFLEIPDAVAANTRMMIYALVLILVVMYRPYGFFGKYQFE